MNDKTVCIAEFSYLCRIPDTQNATNTNQTSRHVHNPVYGHSDKQPARPSRPPAWGGKKTEHTYEVIPPPASTFDKHTSKQRESTEGQAKTHNTGKLLSTF